MLRTLHVCFIALTIILVGCDSKPKEDLEPKEVGLVLTTDDQKLSYGLGFNLGTNILQQNVPGFDKESLFAGIADAIAEEETKVSQEDLQAVIARVQAKEQEVAAELAVKNSELGEKFLAENAKKEGIKITESGLQYEVLTASEGEKPSAESVVKTHYHGTLIDGTVFDSSKDRGAPVEFPVNRLIPGWTEALQLMSVGSKWRLFVPSQLAYGEQSPGPAIPPNSTLIFELELLEIVK